MKENKLLLWLVCAAVAVLAAATTIYIFRNEIIDYCSEVKDKLDKKRLHRNGEYADFADVEM